MDGLEEACRVIFWEGKSHFLQASLGEPWTRSNINVIKHVIALCSHGGISLTTESQYSTPSPSLSLSCLPPSPSPSWLHKQRHNSRSGWGHCEVTRKKYMSEPFHGSCLIKKKKKNLFIFIPTEAHVKYKSMQMFPDFRVTSHFTTQRI